MSAGLEMPPLRRAYHLSRSAHLGQVDKAGQPYFEAHVVPVVRRVQAHGGGTWLQVVALLHDVVEDTSITLTGLRVAGYPAPIVRAVDALTQRPGEVRSAYRLRVAADKIAKAIKVCDHEDHVDPSKPPTTDGPEAAARRAEKYRLDVEIIGLCAYPLDTDGEHDHDGYCVEAIFQEAEDALVEAGLSLRV